MAKSQYLECGKIINTHGVRGGLKLESWCDTPQDLASLKKVYLQNGAEYKLHKVKKASVFKQFVLFELDGISDIDTAMTLRGKVVYADREDISIDEDAFFIADIIGLDVIDLASGEKLGTLSDVLNLGASDLYEIKTANGKKLIPAVPEFIKEIDLEKGIFVSLIEGMLD
ncbi:MAG: 16S rRNA processing protein RimM [Clostridia bacterium]|nr:16S rRNA processing protein RimM [Clostridia bacterium]